MYNCTAIVWRNNVPTEHHIFPLPNFLDPGFSITIRSYSAFRQRENRGLYESQQKAWQTQTKWIPPAIRTSLKDKDEWEVDRKLLVDTLTAHNIPVEPEPNWIRHESLWDYYKAVGYDYKRRRYIQVEDCETIFVATVAKQMAKAFVSFEQFAKGASARYQSSNADCTVRRKSRFENV